MLKNNIDILICFDDNYAPAAGIAMTSIMMTNATECAGITFHIFEDGVSDQNKENIRKAVKAYDNSDVIFYDVHEQVKKYFSDFNDSFSLSAYSRWLACEILPTDLTKVLYIDCDVIVTDGLSGLFEEELSEYCAAAVLDKGNLEDMEIIGLAPTRNYFNTGVLLINLEYWRKNAVLAALIEYGKNISWDFICPDQDMLNIKFSNVIKPLPLQYNIFPEYFAHNFKKRDKLFRIPYDMEEIAYAKANPVIIHFAGKKPWAYGKLIGGAMPRTFAHYYKVKKQSVWKDCQDIGQRKYKIVIVDAARDIMIDVLPARMSARALAVYHKSKGNDKMYNVYMRKLNSL